MIPDYRNQHRAGPGAQAGGKRRKAMRAHRTSLKIVDKPTKQHPDTVPVNGAMEYRQTHTWEEALEELEAALLIASNLAVTINAAFESEHTFRRFYHFHSLKGQLSQAQRRITDLKCSVAQDGKRGPYGKRAARKGKE